MEMRKASTHMPEPLYLAGVGGALNTGVEQRLISAKFLVPRNKAEAEYKRSQRNAVLLSRFDSVNRFELEEKAQSLRERKAFEGALRGNSAFQRLLSRTANGTEVGVLVRAGFLDVDTGVTDFTLLDAKWLAAGGKEESYALNDIRFNQDMFSWDEVTEGTTLHVGGIPLQPQVHHGGVREVKTETRIGIYQVSETMLEWAERKYNMILQASVVRPATHSALTPVFTQDLEWVNDDTGIVFQVIADCNARGDTSPSDFAILISDDLKLYKRLTRTVDITIVLVRPRSWILDLGGAPLHKDSPVDISLYKPVKGRCIGAYKDTGSISAAALKLDIVQDSGGPTPVFNYYRRQLVLLSRSGNTRSERSLLTRVSKHQPVYGLRHGPTAYLQRKRQLVTSSEGRKPG
jgi:hypothetical protein